MDEYREIVEKIYIQQYKILQVFALWELPPNAAEYLKKGYNIYYWHFLIFWVLFFDLLMILQIMANINSMEEVIKVLLMLATAIAVLGKLLTVKAKNRSFENFFKLMFTEKYLPQNSEEREMFLKCIELNTKVRNCYAFISYSACTFFLMTKLIVSDSRDLPLSVYSPIDLETNWKFNIMYAYVCMANYVLCFSNVAFDTLSSSFFIHLKGQLDILGSRLEKIGLNVNLSQDTILQQLKECIRQYNRILKLSYYIEYLISQPISLQIACSVFVLIANFYSLSTLSDSGELFSLLTIGVYQACMLSQIFMLCYFANSISLKSTEISLNLYQSNWYNWNKTNRKLVLLMMLRFDTPIRISSVNRCYSLNLAAFTSIVNSSYSYFALLKRTNS